MTSRHETHELLRKSLHIALGLFIVTLKWLPWSVAAAICAAAAVGNWLVLHRIFGKRVSRHERGYDAGLVIYPLAVGALIVIFRHNLELAAAVWAFLAFGDGFATLAGKSIRGPRLPWNGDKSWSGFAAFLAFGYVGGEYAYRFMGGEPRMFDIVIPALIACAIVESLPLHVDDNLTVPLAGGAVIAALHHAQWWPAAHVDWTWLAVNAALAIAGYLAKSVDVSGALGGWLLGAIIILYGGWPLYAVLLAFFVIGTATTKLGYRRKARLGLAQEKGGRRGFSHAFSNVGMAAMLAVVASMSPDGVRFWLAAAAALATATADTTASEVGQLIGRRTFLPLTLRRVPVGTEGAISVEGTLAGIVAAFAVAVLASAAKFRSLEWRIIGLVTLCAFAGSYLESLVGSWNRNREEPVPNGALNFFNTAAGAGLLLLLVRVA
jgi:uncharacterized protein (TIGR00297 family)